MMWYYFYQCFCFGIRICYVEWLGSGSMNDSSVGSWHLGQTNVGIRKPRLHYAKCVDNY